MVQSDVSGSSANVVEGFSARFNLLLDRAGIPQQNRVSHGARFLNVVHNTFKSWCVQDRIPGSHSSLREIVEKLLESAPGRHNPKAVVAWLLAGDAVPNPFGDDTDALAFVELYLQIADIARREKIAFEKFPREVRNRMLKHVLKHLRAGSSANKPNDVLQLDDAAVRMVIGMLDTASVPREPVRGR
jgi:hypothetical protein